MGISLPQVASIGRSELANPGPPSSQSGDTASLAEPSTVGEGRQNYFPMESLSSLCQYWAARVLATVAVKVPRAAAPESS